MQHSVLALACSSFSVRSKTNREDVLPPPSFQVIIKRCRDSQKLAKQARVAALPHALTLRMVFSCPIFVDLHLLR